MYAVALSSDRHCMPPRGRSSGDAAWSPAVQLEDAHLASNPHNALCRHAGRQSAALKGRPEAAPVGPLRGALLVCLGGLHGTINMCPTKRLATPSKHW